MTIDELFDKLAKGLPPGTIEEAKRAYKKTHEKINSNKDLRDFLFVITKAYSQQFEISIKGSDKKITTEPEFFSFILSLLTNLEMNGFTLFSLRGLDRKNKKQRNN